jgi:hypothetical protein
LRPENPATVSYPLILTAQRVAASEDRAIASYRVQAFGDPMRASEHAEEVLHAVPHDQRFALVRGLEEIRYGSRRPRTTVVTIS